jgi:allantoinase
MNEPRSQAWPGQSVRVQSVPVQSLPGQPVPGQPVPGEHGPGGAAAADLVVRSARVALGGGVTAAAIVVKDGRIESVADYGARLPAAREVDLGDLALLPGLVDSHVHVNEPGRTGWEGFASATAAALAGGITTICDMPLSSVPVTTTASALAAKLAAASGQCAVDVAFWGGAVPGNDDQIEALLDAGVIGLKCFLAGSGAAEFPPLDTAGLRQAMRRLAGAGVPLAVHAEDPGEVSEPAGPTYDAFVASRPPTAERRAIEAVVAAAAATGAQAHIAHLSAGECAALIGAAQAAGISLTAETCPHYLYFAAEEVPAGHTEFKCCPPIRYAPNREALWRALEAGVISGIVSGHSPCAPELKKLAEGDFRTARGGIASLQVALPAVWSAARKRGRTLSDIARWMSLFPAQLAGLDGRKGVIAAGADADLVAFDPEAAHPVSAADLLHKSPVSPYDGRTLTGRVRRTWLRGVEVTPGGPRHGRLLRRGGAAFGA